MKRLLLGLVVALMDDGLAGPRVATGGGGGSVRVSGWGSCDLLSLPGRVEAIQRACCANAASCADGTPDRCDATCAQAYLPFFFDCQHVLETSMQQPAGSSDDPLQSFGLLEARCSALLGAPRTLAVTGLLNSYMDGTYELEDSVNGMPHWVNRDGCHCDNCLGTACHLYWAISHVGLSTWTWSRTRGPPRILVQRHCHLLELRHGQNTVFADPDDRALGRLS